MITMSSNIEIIVRGKLQQIQELKNNPDPVLRAVALTVLPELKKRVHVDGKDSSGGQIGTYSPGYMVVRTGTFKNAEKFSRGKNAGKIKNAGRFTDRTIRLNKQTGVFSGEEKTGTLRPRYNRTADTKVILSLTRQMENDLSVIDTDKGYGIGYLNSENFKKAMYCEATYGKKILSQLTAGETVLAHQTAQQFTAEYLKKIN